MKYYSVKELRRILLKTEGCDLCDWTDDFLDYLEKMETE